MMYNASKIERGVKMNSGVFYYGTSGNNQSSKDDYYKVTFLKARPYTCPVCGGRGFVRQGFYDTFCDRFITSTMGKETCRTCKGVGIVWQKG